MELRDSTPRLTLPAAPVQAAPPGLPEPLQQRLQFFGTVQRLGLDVRPIDIALHERQLWFGPRWRLFSPLVLFGTFYGLAALIGWGVLPLLVRVADVAGAAALSVAAILVTLATAGVPFAAMACAGALGQALAVVRVDGQSFVVTQTGQQIQHPTMPRHVQETLEQVRAGRLPHIERVVLLEQQVDPILVARVGGRWYCLGRWE